MYDFTFEALYGRAQIQDSYVPTVPTVRKYEVHCCSQTSAHPTFRWLRARSAIQIRAVQFSPVCSSLEARCTHVVGTHQQPLVRNPTDAPRRPHAGLPDTCRVRESLSQQVRLARAGQSSCNHLSRRDAFVKETPASCLLHVDC